MNNASINNAFKIAVSTLMKVGSVRRTCKVFSLLKICKMLLDAGACLAGLYTNVYLIHYCCYYRDTKLLKQALQSASWKQLSCLLKDETCINGEKMGILRISIGFLNTECLSFILTHYAQYWTQEIGELQFNKDAMKLAFELQLLDFIKILLQFHMENDDVLSSVDDDITWEFILHHVSKREYNGVDSLLSTVVKKNDWSSLTYLLNSKLQGMLNINMQLSDTELTLTMAVKQNNTTMVKELLKAGANPSLCVTDYFYGGNSPLVIAIHRLSDTGDSNQDGFLDYEVIKLLVRYGCRVKVTKSLMNTSKYSEDTGAISRAADMAMPGLLEILWFAGANVYLQHRSYPNARDQYDNHDFSKTRTLKQWCRLSIHDALGSNLVGKVCELEKHIPMYIADYLLLPELDEIKDTKNDLDRYLHQCHEEQWRASVEKVRQDAYADKQYYEHENDHALGYYYDDYNHLVPVEFECSFKYWQ